MHFFTQLTRHRTTSSCPRSRSRMSFGDLSAEFELEEQRKFTREMIKLIKDRHCTRVRSPSPQPKKSSVKSDKKSSKKSRSKSIDARRKDENRCVIKSVEFDQNFSNSRVWARTSSAPSTCCEDELKVWNTFRKRLISNSSDVPTGKFFMFKTLSFGHTFSSSILERIEHMRGLESRINVITDKGCCLYQATRNSRLFESAHKRPDMKTASLGRRTRAGQHRPEPVSSINADCESRYCIFSRSI